jgi:hypothetical protein
MTQRDETLKFKSFQCYCCRAEVEYWYYCLISLLEIRSRAS